MEEKYNGVYFQVKITPESRRKPKTQDEDKDVVLVMAPFNKLPKLLFKNVKVGTSELQHIIVRNPNDSRIEIQLDRLPPEKCGLTFSAVKFGVEAHEDERLEVTWTPSEAKTWHHVIQVKNSHHLKLDISIACISVDPQKGNKRNVKPLKVQNACVNALLTSKKGGVKSLSRSKTEVSSGVKKRSQSVNRAFRTTLNKVNKLKQEYNISSEQFATIKDNRLPPCSVPSTPTRRETYLVFQETGIANKENAEFKHMQQRTKSANDICVPVDLRLKQLRTSKYSSSIQNVSPVLATPPRQRRFGDKNAELKFCTETYSRSPHKSSLCTVGRKRLAKESNDDSSPDHNQKFLDMLNCLSFTPTPSRPNQAQQEVTSNLQYSSPEGSLLPPCNISPTPDRRQTYAIPPGSKPENELQMPSSEETVFTMRRIRYVHTTCTSVPRMQLECDEFNDSLEEQNDIFKKNLVAENGAEQWSQWQKHNFSRSEGSSEESNGKHRESLGKTPRSKICSTGLTPQFDKLNFSNQSSILFCPGSPVDFSLLPPTEDTRRCSTVMKKLEQMSDDSPYNAICKDLFSTDLVEYVANDSISHDELSCLSSGTFVKSGSSFPDINFQYPDISCQESVSQQNNYQLDQERKKPQVSLSPEENSAQNVIEADLWVTQSTEKFLAKTTVSANVHALDSIAEERKFINSFSPKEQKSEESKKKLSAIPVKQFKKSGSAESRGVFLEISPPRRQVYDLCGSTAGSVQKQKTSCPTGWSKTSVKSRNYQRLNFTQGASCQLNGTASNLTGKKRPFDGIKTNQNVSKRRILCDGSICNSSNPRVGASAQRPLRRGSSSSIPRKAFTKLTLSTSKKQKEEAIQLHNPDAVLNKLANPGLFEATNTAEPFTTSSVYYDEEWMVQQEKEFTKWLNSLLTPPEELNCTTALPKVDVTELWIQSCRKQDIVLAPTREMVSSQYHTHHRLDALRKAACSLFRSQEIAQVLSKVAVHVDKKLITIRSDRDLHLDFGLKCQVMKLLLSYNPLWLRIGLEAIYGQTITLESNSDVQGLTKFIATRLLSDPYIVQQNSHPTVSHLFLPGFEDAMKKFTLKKFLLLVYFLDKAKEKKLISHDPCLFCKDAELKDSRQILLAFSRDLLSGIGDITKHLKSLGYIVTQRQTYLDEFEYAVNCLGKDLRDGIRLTRVMEIILQNRTLSNELRAPAVSRLQKIHNVDVALLALNGAGYVLTGNITAKDISDGHREKTLSLLWQIIYKFQEPRFIDAAKKIQYWWRCQSLKLEICRRIQARELAHLTRAATRIQAYWRSYRAQMQLKILKEQQAVNYATQQKASIVIQKNWRMYFEHKKYAYVLKSVKKIQSWYRNMKMAKKEQIQFLERRQTLMNFQAVCRGYVYRKRLASLQRTAAALKIQTWYRRHVERQKIESLIPLIRKCIEEERLVYATITIQKKFRATMLMQAERQHFLQLKLAAVVIQRRLRATLLMKKQVEWYQRQKYAASIIQNKFRATVLMRAQRQHYLQQKSAAIVTQRRFRAVLLMKKQVEWYQQQRSAASIIQSKFRATVLMRAQRQHYLQQKCAAVVIQRRFRATLLTKKQVEWYQQQRSAASIIQNKFRATVLMRAQRQHYLQQKCAAVVIQRRFHATILTKKQVEWYQQQRTAASIIQNKFRATVLMRAQRQHYLQQKCAAVVIQRRFRAALLMRKQVEWYKQQSSAASIIQNKFRATVLMRSERQQFLKQKFAAVVIQRKFKAMLIMKKQVQWYHQQRSAASIIQNKFRATLLMRLQRQHFLQQKYAATDIQRKFRATLLMKKQVEWYQKQRSAASIIQNKFRATMLMRFVRQQFLEQKLAAKVIQRRFRATLLMKNQMQKYHLQRYAASIIQKKFRATMMMKFERQQFLKQKFSATVIQRRFRAMLMMKKQMQWYQQQRSAAVIIQRKLRATMIMQTERQYFLKRKIAVILIQRLFRAKLLMKKHVQKCQLQIFAASIIQNKFRATMLMRSERQHFLKQKFSAIIIQRRFRATLLMQKEAEWYQQQRFAAIVIQNKFRATMLMRSERQHFLEIKMVAQLIQKRFRAKKLTRMHAQRYQLQQSAANIIQVKFRATLLMRSERENFLKKKSAAITIQNKFTAKILGQKERSSFLEKKSAALVIQRWFRANLMRKEKEHCSILKSRQEEHRKQTAAAIKIQALWRGYRERKTGTQEMVAVRERASSTTQNALPGTTLQTRSTAALFILQKTCSGRLIWALMELDTITQLSPKLCVDIASSSVVKTIYKYLGNANRSEVDKEMSTVATKVLINLAKYEKSAASVWQVPGNVSIIMNLMSAWCGKNDPLFCNCCTLLWLFAQDPTNAMKIVKVPQVEQRLTHYYKQLKQKQERTQTLMKGSSKVKAKQPKFVLPSFKPDWSLTGACLQQTFENPLHAVSSVIEQLNIKPDMKEF